MSINVCSEKAGFGISPRISFSQDPKNTISVESPRKQDTCILDSSSDFVFCITNGVPHKLSSADELFSNGKIVPKQITRISKAPPHQPHHQPHFNTQKKRLKEFLSEPDDDDTQEHDKPNSSSKHFWRSSSLNCDGATRGKRLLRSSLQFLSRSYSTGSAPNTPKHGLIRRGNAERHRLQKQSSASSLSLSLSSSSSASSSAYYFYDSAQKPSLKKNCGSSAGNAVRISPVLNLPRRKASKSFFGFGSLFCNGKIKSKK
ncbi:uncharacterized protein LOC113870342 [Abrus precatorius]|uniref:Uncharacterized protein LOC113870342 n=1 Tax=Abrus precatorius TaxID=3816 RepID=A0A8B8M238_ABRPR|nr:uncharacterized protein LOC113870342 [Abrus precatorius]